MWTSIRGVVPFEAGKTVGVIRLAIDANTGIENAYAALTKTQVVKVAANVCACLVDFGHDEATFSIIRSAHIGGRLVKLTGGDKVSDQAYQPDILLRP
jgi:hypothetical protein